MIKDIKPVLVPLLPNPIMVMSSLSGRYLTVAIEKDRFGTIAFDPLRRLLFLIWLQGADKMPVDILKGNLSIFADLILEKNIESVLVDLREGCPRLTNEMHLWRQENIVPKYNIVLKRCAFLASITTGKLPK
jgi:hypothetical protein